MKRHRWSKRVTVIGALSSFLPTEVIAHLPHPIHNLVWFALRKVREGTHTLPGVNDDVLAWASAIRCESSGLRCIEGDRE
jgi:hypothetical protein